MKVNFKDVKINKEWHWECPCCANGYESTKEDAEERVRLHIDANHKREVTE